MTNILKKIIADKKYIIEKYKKSHKINDLKNKIFKYENYFNFKETI